MKTVLTLILMIAVIFCLTAAPTKASASGEELILEVGRDLANLFGGIIFSSSDSKSPKKEYTSAEEIQKNTREVREDVIKKAKERWGFKLTCDTFYEGIKVNPRITILTFNGTNNNIPTLISIFFTADADNAKTISYNGRFIIWEDIAEYKAKSSKKYFAAKYAKYFGVDPGPVDEEDLKKTPETAPADTAPPAPSTALSNNP